MKNISTYISEKLRISAKAPQYSHVPKTRDDLTYLVEELLIERGNNADLNDIDVSNITQMDNVFRNCHDENFDISEWDMSNVETASSMFYGCQKFNCDLSKWNVSEIENCIKYVSKM